MSFLSRAVVLLAGLTVLPLSALAGEAAVSGTAIYRERIALPPSAVFTAMLLDVSKQDTGAVELARTVIDPAGHPPYRFELSYDSAAIEPQNTYAVRATITDGDRLMFTTDTVHRVITQGAGKEAEIVLRMVHRPQRSGEAPLSGETTPGAQPEPARFHGLFRYLADAAMFQVCRTGQRFPVAMEKQFPRMERAYANVAVEPGAPALASVWATIEARPKMEGQGTEPAMIVHRLDNMSGDQECLPPIPDASLTDTYWRLTDLAGERVGGVPGNKEPHILLESASSRYHATAGCNGLGGQYELDGGKLTLKPGISTMMACQPPVDEYERGLKEALNNTVTWEIAGVVLSLLDAEGNAVARFRAVYLQ